MCCNAFSRSDPKEIVMRRRILTAGLLSLLAAAPVLAAPILAGPARAETDKPPMKREFLSLGDFTVNLPPQGRRPGYVVIGVTVEADTAAIATLKAIAPRVREVVLARLLDMSSRGEMQPGHTDPLQVKDALTATIIKLQPDGVNDVLITRILYS
jgi:flagellar basal body-associated protein FliL